MGHSTLCQVSDEALLSFSAPSLSLHYISVVHPCNVTNAEDIPGSENGTVWKIAQWFEAHIKVNISCV